MIKDEFGVTGIIPKFLLETTETARCSEVDPDLFTPMDKYKDLKGGSRGKSQYINEGAAKQICSTCPLKVECLVYALEADQIGIWGGTTDRERQNMKRRVGSNSYNLRKVAYIA